MDVAHIHFNYHAQKNPEEVYAVVLETDGALSVVKRGVAGEASTLESMEVPGHESSGEEKETPDREKA